MFFSVIHFSLSVKPALNYVFDFLIHKNITDLDTSELLYLKRYINPLSPELNPSAQRYLTIFLLGILLLEPCISLTYA
jgi:hypothetical protein